MVGQPAQPFDQAIRQLFGQAPGELARVVLGVDLSGDVRCLPTQVFTRRLEVDGLVVRADPQRAVHIEFQTNADRDLGQRMLRYRVGLEESYGQVEQHVVLLHPEADFDGIGRYDTDALHLRYQVHRLWQIDPELFLATPVLAPLAPLGWAESIEAREQLAERALARVADLETPVESQAVTWLLLLGTLYLGRTRLEELIRRSAVLINIEDLPLAMEWKAESEAKGHAEGLAEGLEEGRAEGRVEGRLEGRAEGRVEALAYLVRLKYGDDALVDRLAQMDPSAFEEASQVLLHADRAVFVSWLEAHQG